MAPFLPVRSTWWTRLLRAVRLLPVREGDHKAGADYAEDFAAQPGYEIASAMSAYAAFPWVRACVNAIAGDLAGLPLRAVRGTGKTAKVLDGHPALDLLAQPSSRVAVVLLRRQLVVDYLLAGDAYVLWIGRAKPESLLRLHPSRTKIHPLADGQPAWYEYDTQGGTARYDWERVLHFRQASWADTPESLYGTGAIQALHYDLTTDQAAQKLAARSSQMGQPTGILGPASADDMWTEDQIKELRIAYEKQLRLKSGTVLLSGHAKYTAVSWSPREMEYSALREAVKASILAEFGVPPVRVGLETANYATALQQIRIYWEGLVGRAALVDVTLSRLPRLMGDSDVTLRHDFASVEALQESRSERVKRVEQWWMMGVPLAAAAAYEGFDDLPVPARPEKPAKPAEDQPAKDAVGVQHSQGGVTRSQESDRAAVWRTFADRYHAPAERALLLVVRRALKAQAERTAERAAEVLGPRLETAGVWPPAGSAILRDLTDDELDRIVQAAEEAKALADASRGSLRQMLLDAFARAVEELGATGGYDPLRLNVAVESQLAELVTETAPTTRAILRQTIQAALVEGASIGEIQSRIIRDHAFGAVRALAIARTETTESLSAGALEGFRAARDQGIALDKEWLTARDEEVREEHAAMDGQVRALDETFTAPNGETAQAPGGFESAAMVVNCRCTVVARRKAA